MADIQVIPKEEAVNLFADGLHRKIITQLWYKRNSLSYIF